ncbi:MAG: excinuclease ABC subunit UvrC [Spirochaetales bacterium]|nr:excinuclease ABC subunit UvrC [Spirochaetales bacterium]
MTPEEIRFELKEAIRQFPDSPGVYLMKDRREKIIYVGKAKSLKKRVGSYFTGKKDVKTDILVRRIRSIETIATNNEYEALLLENTLIKKWNPRYNISLKDGKSYPVIRVTREEFPRVFRTRRIIQDGSDYFGPYPSAVTLDAYLELVNRLYPLRKCRGKLKKRDAPCLYYHIHQCSGPCADMISKKDYGKQVRKVKDLLSGNSESLIKKLTREMKNAAADLDFEKAARIRDSIEGIGKIDEEQGVVDFDQEKRDYVALEQEGEFYTFVVFQMRGGKLVGRDLFRTESPVEPEEALPVFLLQYYSRSQDPPVTLFIPFPIEVELITQYFMKEKGADVSILPVEDNKDRVVMNMARENAIQDGSRRKQSREKHEVLEELQQVLSLSKLPRRIEGFDIAQLSGKYPVSSLISFYNGKPDKKNYRYFRLKSLDGMIDDYESIREAVARRYTRVLNEGLPKPDLVLIDGGKGQVSAARGVLDAIGFTDIPVAGLAKQNEEIYLPGRSKPILLPEGNEALRVLQAVRDETHRFATSLNQKLRHKSVRAERLESIPGIGPARSKKLLTTFGSLDDLCAAEPSAVAEAAGIPLKKAEEIISVLLEVNGKVKNES